MLDLSDCLDLTDKDNIQIEERGLQMRNFKEILKHRIEQILDEGFAQHIPLTSDYLAEKLLTTLDESKGERKLMERQLAQIVIMANLIPLDKTFMGSEIVNTYDKWVDRQAAAMELNAAIEMAADMLFDPVKHLTAEELQHAYELQQHEYDKSDIEDELDEGYDDYVEIYNIDEKPVTDDEIDRMAIELRRLLNNNADACWSVSRTEAVTSILRKRNDD